MWGVGMWLGGLVMLVFWGALIVVAALVVRQLAGGLTERDVRTSPLDILKRRYSSAEITREQYEQMRKTSSHSPQSGPLKTHFTVTLTVSRSSTLVPPDDVATSAIVYAPGLSVTSPVTLTFVGVAPGLTDESSLLSWGSAAEPFRNPTRIVPLYFVAPDFTGWRYR